LQTVVRLLNWWQGQDMFMSWEAIYDELASWLDQADSPYFVWIFLVDAHMPFIPRAEYRTQSRLLTYPANAWLFTEPPVPFESRIQKRLTTAYDNTVRDTDAFLDRLTTDLDEVGAEPLIAVHADHGEELGEDGSYGHGSLSDDVLHVPLVVGNGPDDRISDPFSLEDMTDLLVALALEEDYQDIAGPVARSRTFNSKAVNGRSWKYVRSSDGAERFAERDGELSPSEREGLQSLYHRFFDAWETTDRERKSVQKAVAEVSETASL